MGDSSGTDDSTTHGVGGGGGENDSDTPSTTTTTGGSRRRVNVHSKQMKHGEIRRCGLQYKCGLRATPVENQ